MSTEAKEDELRAFYCGTCMSFQLGLRALSLYSPEHSGTKKKVAHLFQLLSTYLSQKTSITLLFVGAHVTVEDTGLPEISGNLKQLIRWMGAIHLERVVFRRGLGSGELVRFLQLLLSLFKEPSNADLVLAKNQESLPHILTGRTYRGRLRVPPRGFPRDPRKGKEIRARPFDPDQGPFHRNRWATLQGTAFQGTKGD